jgi:hypothetical protein
MEWGLSGGHPPCGGDRLVALVAAPGPFRAAARRGGWRLAIAVFSSLCMLAFVIGVAVGQLAIGIAALIIGAPPTWFLYIRLFRDGQSPERGNETSD